ncbi:hypothetical protein [Streptomyces graminilatus]|uniref:hypothetical protein n=1 Tax=Streptomyces graminilatus TaxID=1464070 RepID=UPI000AC5C5CD|nr:hypothetical protein [Streptomyces graminilatus]
MHRRPDRRGTPTPTPGGLTDNGTKGKRARKVPIAEEIRLLGAPRSLPSPIVMTR